MGHIGQLIDRPARQGLVELSPDPADRRALRGALAGVHWTPADA
jgi:DNA-binding MarR family transcriptional regulator